MLDDGTYEVVVVEARDDADRDAGTVALDLAVLTGPHKGEVITVRASGLDHDPLDLLALPATLTVAGGEPSVRIDD